MTIKWVKEKPIIEHNGWTLERCTPLAELEILFYFIPLGNLVVFYFVWRLLNALTQQKNEGQVVSLYFWKFGMHYSEPD